MDSIDELRKAAAAERDEWGGADNVRSYPKSSPIHLALADWLEKTADRLEGTCDCHWPAEPFAVARAINAAASA